MPEFITGKKSSNIKTRKKKKIDIGLKKEKEVRKTIPRKKPAKRRKKKKRLRDINWKESINFSKLKLVSSWIFKILITILLAYVFVCYFGQRVSAVGDSMNPRLNNGDVVLVNRFVYNTSSPKRGDLIVFKPKGNENSHYYIKRVIGLPGETIEFLEGNIYINGEKLQEEYESTPVNDVGIITEKIELNGDEYFVLGDVREKSEDSRMADVGNVKRKYIYGKAWFVISPISRFGFL